MTPSDVLKFVSEKGAKMLDLRFLDFPGLWQHLTVPISELSEDVFADGFGFDGSSIRGWQAIHASDMLIVPDAASAQIDPFMKVPTLVMICDIEDPITRERYSRDPRNIAKKAEAYLQSSGIADTSAIPSSWSSHTYSRTRSSKSHRPAPSWGCVRAGPLTRISTNVRGSWCFPGSPFSSRSICPYRVSSS